MQVISSLRIPTSDRDIVSLSPAVSSQLVPVNHSDRSDRVMDDLAQIINHPGSSKDEQPAVSKPPPMSQNIVDARVNLMSIPTDFSLEVALNSPYAFEIVGSKVSLKQTSTLAVSSAWHLERDVVPTHRKQTAPPPAIFETQVPVQPTGSNGFRSQVDNNNVLVKTETVVIVGSRMLQSEAVSKTTTVLLPPPFNQQKLDSVVSRADIQLRVSNAHNSIFAPEMPTIGQTPAPTHGSTSASYGQPNSNLINIITTHAEDDHTPTYSINPAEKRITNGNGTSSRVKAYKLADGDSNSSHKSGFSIRNSSSPSSQRNPSSRDDTRGRGSAGDNEKPERQVPDSGASVDYRNKNRANSNSKIPHNTTNAATVTMYALQHHQNADGVYVEQIDRPRIPHVDEQDAYATEALDRKYLSYRTNKGLETIRSAAIVDAETHTKATFTKPTKVIPTKPHQPSTHDGRSQWERSKNEGEGNASNSAKYNCTMREPAKVLLPMQKHAQIDDDSDNQSRRIRVLVPVPLDARPNHRYREMGLSRSSSVASNNLDHRQTLLDTSSVNPGITSENADSLNGLYQKPRKLVRGSTKRDKKVELSKDLDNKESNPTTNSSLSLRAMLRPQSHAQKNHRDEQKIKQKEQVYDTTSSDPDLEQKAPNNQGDTQQLAASIESISDNYQLAVRHKPPLGPLRAVEPHVPALSDELVVERGDRMYVFGEFADGWVLSMNITRGSECGMVPRRCIFFPTAPFMTKEAIQASNASPISKKESPSSIVMLE
ncbi:hypothetical protein GGI25_000087 [Coemansia spiralis]|uniref:SH3 domain-containing protein n=1 Tax=Coemansia spiralis TaxID=417178 RepID=A0A9W8L1E6_9FUNG|nr:hypothetical protein GGI25_000087 [Coemansia spiralis]